MIEIDYSSSRIIDLINNNQIDSLVIFDRTIDGDLWTLHQYGSDFTFLLEKRFLVGEHMEISAGYYFLHLSPSHFEEKALEKILRLYDHSVHKNANSNFQEIYLLILATSFAHLVIDFVSDYNQFQNRKPIELYKLRS